MCSEDNPQLPCAFVAARDGVVVDFYYEAFFLGQSAMADFLRVHRSAGRLLTRSCVASCISKSAPIPSSNFTAAHAELHMHDFLFCHMRGYMHSQALWCTSPLHARCSAHSSSSALTPCRQLSTRPVCLWQLDCYFRDDGQNASARVNYTTL